MRKNKHIVRSFDKDLSKLQDILLLMIESSRNILNEIYNLIVDKKSSNDINIEELLKKLNEASCFDTAAIKLSLNILSLRNPVAYDLRFVFASSHISQNLERILANSKNIIQQVTDLSEINIDVETKLLQMIHVITSMLYDLHISFNEGNISLTDKIILQEQEISRLSDEISTLSIEKLVANNNNDLHSIIKGSILICKYLERIGEHISNICKHIRFIENNEHL